MEKTKKGIDPVNAAAAGVVVGIAGAAMAAALVHEPTRKKMGKTLHEITTKMQQKVKEFQKFTEPVKKKSQEKMQDSPDTIKKENVEILSKIV